LGEVRRRRELLRPQQLLEAFLDGRLRCWHRSLLTACTCYPVPLRWPAALRSPALHRPGPAAMWWPRDAAAGRDGPAIPGGGPAVTARATGRRLTQLGVLSTCPIRQAETRDAENIGPKGTPDPHAGHLSQSPHPPRQPRATDLASLPRGDW